MKIEIIVKVDGREVMNQTITEEPEKKIEDSVSQYARFFDESNPIWSEDPKMNLMFLKQQQEYATRKLRIIGHLFLNEVYDMLGMPKSKAGQLVGWIYDEDNPIGDNYVDFGIFTEKNAPSVDGFKNAILLDFNVDGNILDKLTEKEGES